MRLQAAIDALHDHAATWDLVAAATASAGDAAGLLALTETSMSFAAGRTGLLDTYNALTDRIAQLLAEGADVQHQLAVTLDQIAVTYTASDERAASAFKGVWDVK